MQTEKLRNSWIGILTDARDRFAGVELLARQPGKKRTVRQKEERDWLLAFAIKLPDPGRDWIATTRAAAETRLGTAWPGALYNSTMPWAMAYLVSPATL